MNEDIVSKLKRFCTCWTDKKCLQTEAVEEIERVRADRDRWKNWAEEYFYTDPDCECPLCDQVKAAINNG